MRIYISCHHPDSANELAAALVAAGHEVISSWHSDPTPRPAPDDAKAWGEKAANNLAVIRTADALVLIAKPETPRKVEVDGVTDYFGNVPGGKFYEAGFAHGFAAGFKGKPAVFVLGRVENGMLNHPAVKVCPDTPALIEAIR